MSQKETHSKIKNEIEEVQSEVQRLESFTARAKGLIALSSSFLEKGEYAEAVNLVTLARFEIARIATLLSESPSPEGKKTITYRISNINEPEESLWVSQGERVIFIHALESLADDLDLQMDVCSEPSGVMSVSLKRKEQQIVRLERTVKMENRSISVRIDVVCEDRAIFEAIFTILKERLTELSRYLTDLCSDPVVPPVEKDILITRLKERERADVEEILVLHSDGRLMCHISSLHAEDVDYDILGAMILALQSFVQDSFQKRFDEIAFSGKRILLVPGDNVNVALVVRGEPSERFKKMVLESITAMESTLGQRIAQWNGDVTVANEISPYLEMYIHGGKPQTGGGQA